jgi:RimJ/RimL family protein N-acetyltransferase
MPYPDPATAVAALRAAFGVDAPQVCHHAAMGHPCWPIFDLRLTVGELELRPLTEADLVPLSDLRPPDVEIDPRLPDLGGGDERLRAGAALHQSYWSSFGSWRTDNWRLGFVALVAGVYAGGQEIEAAQFAVRRTVETASWLSTAWRGRGIGKAMRLTVLALAFDGLGAEVAETEAWHDNAASLGVSRSLGYVDNGVGRHVRGDRADDMPRMRLTRATWLARHAQHGVRVDGLDGCRRLFGAPG